MTHENTLMATSAKSARGLILLWLLFLRCFLSAPVSGSAGEDAAVSQCLRVPADEFVSSVKNTIVTVRQVTSAVSQFAGLVGDDFRVYNAVSDCLDLLDSSADQLGWSVSAAQNPKGKSNSTGNLGSDLKTWLSAAIANQETCMDGFEGSNSIVEGMVSTGIRQLSSLLVDALAMVESAPDQPGSHKHSGEKDFPSWVGSDDRKLLQVDGMAVDVVVATDGTGNFTRIMDAVQAAPDYSMKRFVIYIKRGVYRENVEIKRKKWSLMMIGDGMDATVISGNRSYADGLTTFKTATFAVSGQRFVARDITFENTAGPEKHQAVALRCDSDLSVFFRCAIRGFQDTLYTHTMRQFYRECLITGTVDFIFGDATAVFQSCQILARQGLPDQKNTITAHGRKCQEEPTGFSIQFCNISGVPNNNRSASGNSTLTYLGRPWKEFSRTIIMQSYINGDIKPEGWLEWSGDFALKTLFYGEYMNYGPGASLGSRVKWPGYHPMNQSSQVANFTVAGFIKGNLWLPSTGVTFTAGLGV